MTPIQLDIEGETYECGRDWPFGRLERHHYGVILADPPWRFRTWSPKGDGRSAIQHYDVLNLDQIKALPVRDLSARNSVLLMWAISSMLPQALDVMDAWGYTYKTTGFVWAKMSKRSSYWLPKWHIGTGYYTRANVEICLLGTRGHPKRQDAGVRELVVSPVREHSRKPDEIIPAIERLFDGPYCELFAREKRTGWARWGNQTTKFNDAKLEVKS